MTLKKVSPFPKIIFNIDNNKNNSNNKKCFLALNHYIWMISEGSYE